MSALGRTPWHVFVTVCFGRTALSMANASPCMPSGAMSQVFFPPGGPSPPGSTVMQQGIPISVPSMAAQAGFAMMDVTTTVQGPGGAAMPSLPLPPAGISFMIQIGLTRESVLMPQNADLAYVKQIACSIVDTKVGSVFVWKRLIFGCVFCFLFLNKKTTKSKQNNN